MHGYGAVGQLLQVVLSLLSILVRPVDSGQTVASPKEAMRNTPGSAFREDDLLMAGWNEAIGSDMAGTKLRISVVVS